MIAIIDYGAGNITSIKNILKLLNLEVIITNQKELLKQADKIIFPGVGHAKYAMQKLQDYDLIEFIQNLEKPFLGICLGLQLMCTNTEEGNTKGLSIIPAKVKKLPSDDIIPHMGWNNVHYQDDTCLFKDIMQDSDFYFVHSYYVEPNEYCIAKSEYILEFCSAVQKDNFYGVQFHPEKSGNVGKKLLENFLSL